MQIGRKMTDLEAFKVLSVILEHPGIQRDNRDKKTPLSPPPHVMRENCRERIVAYSTTRSAASAIVIILWNICLWIY